MKCFPINPVRYKTARAIISGYVHRTNDSHPPLASIIAAGYWAYCVHARGRQPAQIHYWAAPKISKSVITGMFAHELYHLAGHHEEALACEVQAVAGFASELAEDYRAAGY